MGEGDDIVDARAEQHNEDPEPDKRLGRRKLNEDHHQDGHGREIDSKQCPEEPAIAERLTQRGERHLQEGHEEHECQRRTDCWLQTLSAAEYRGDDCSETDRHKIHRDLPRLQQVPQFLSPHAALACAARRFQRKPSASSTSIANCARIVSRVE